MPEKINKNTTLAQVLKHPKLAEILSEYQVPCLGCPMARFEMENLTLGEIAERYNIDIKGLLKALNK